LRKSNFTITKKGIFSEKCANLLKISRLKYLLLGLLLLLTLADVSEQTKSDKNLEVTIEATGLTIADLNEIVAEALEACQVHSLLDSAKHRLLSSEFLLVQNEVYSDIKSSTLMFQAIVYDYTNFRIIFIKEISRDLSTLSVTIANIQPLPTPEELIDAARIADIGIGVIVIQGLLPTIPREFLDGTSHRVLNLVIYSTNSTRPVYININNETVEFQALVSLSTIQLPLQVYSVIITKQLGSANFVIRRGGKVL
jgi:hypothetical protein